MIISSIYQGLLYGILGLGIYMTFRILDFPDLTTEGSFPLQTCSSTCLPNHLGNRLIASLASFMTASKSPDLNFTSALLYQLS